MSKSVVQISARVTPETKVLLDRRVRESGIKKERLIEDALREYLAALDELPDDAIVRRHVVVSAHSTKTILRHLKDVLKPSDALKALMHGD